jgi:hypothetical protein
MLTDDGIDGFPSNSPMATLDIVIVASRPYPIHDKCSNCLDGGKATCGRGSHIDGEKSLDVTDCKKLTKIDLLAILGCLNARLMSAMFWPSMEWKEQHWWGQNHLTRAVLFRGPRAFEERKLVRQ